MSGEKIGVDVFLIQRNHPKPQAEAEALSEKP